MAAWLTNINLNLNELQNAVLHPLSVEPSVASSKEGQVYFNSTSKLLNVFNGTEWVAVGSPYVLPTMSSTVKGGAKLGNGLQLSGDTLSLGTPSTITTSTTNAVTGNSHTHAITGVEPTISLTSGLALISNASGKVAVSATTATELGYVHGVTSPIQSQIDNIPKYIYQTGLNASGTLNPTTATQTQIDAIVKPVISAAYTAPQKWWAVVFNFVFLPSDVSKDLMYYYNGADWIFLYYMTTGVQLANGTTAGIVSDADINSDISFVGGIGTVNTATKLRAAKAFSISGQATSGAVNFDGTSNVALSVTALNVSSNKVDIASGDGLIISDSSNGSNLAQSNLIFGTSEAQFLSNKGTWATPANTNTTYTLPVGAGGTGYAAQLVLTGSDDSTSAVKLVNGSNITISPNATNGTITIGASIGVTNVTAGTDLVTSPAGGITSTGSISHKAVTCNPTTTDATLTYGGTFSAIDGVTVSNTGHITGYNTKTFTLPDISDTKVTANELGTASGNYPVLTQGTVTSGTVNGTVGKDTNVFINPSTGVLTANGFSGSLSGNATTATTLATPRNFNLSGVTTGGAVSFNGSTDVTINVTAVPASLITGVLPVSKGGTGVSTLPSGKVLIGNGTGAVTSKEIIQSYEAGYDTSALATSGAIASMVQSIVVGERYRNAVHIITMPTTTNTVESPSYSGTVISVMVVDSVTKEQVFADVEFSSNNATSTTVTVTCASNPVNALNIIIATMTL